MKKLGVRTVLSHMDLLHLPLDEAKNYAKREMTHNLAKELINAIDIDERPLWESGSKELRAEVYLITAKEFKELELLKLKYQEIERIVNI